MYFIDVCADNKKQLLNFWKPNKDAAILSVIIQICMRSSVNCEQGLADQMILIC